MVKLGKRLQAIYELVDTDSIVADIGCDHGLLCIALIERQRARHCYGCDIAPGPLGRAQQAVKDAALSAQITLLLQDGMQGLPLEVDTVVIAGMGNETIQKILIEGRERWGQFRSLILASHTDVDLLRRFLSDQHFAIDEERIVFEQRHYYQIIKAHYDMQARSLSEAEIRFGVHTQKEALFVPYWQKELGKCEQILKQMPKDHARYAAVKQRHAQIADVLAKQAAQIKRE